MGCTACSAIITPTNIIVGNAGDSRAVLGKNDEGGFVTVEMSNDHKPDRPSEKERITKAGGFVRDNRVLGILNLSRSIGDIDYKTDDKLTLPEQMVTANPEINE